LVDHIPVKAFKDGFVMCMLLAENWPQLGTDGAVYWPGIVSDDLLYFTFPS
jgi:hypothetical protein